MASPKCLIVDDDSVCLALLTEILDRLGYECLTAADGDSASKMLTDGSFNIMITDIAMKGIDGIELTRKAKKLYPEMPVVIMTGFTDKFSYDMAIEVGAADFLKKPFTLLEVQTRIARVMRDIEAMAISRKKGQELGAMGNEMITGLQEESQEKLRKLQALEDEVARLKRELGAGD
jgi:DNA-binding NtrC family response regulator